MKNEDRTKQSGARIRLTRDLVPFFDGPSYSAGTEGTFRGVTQSGTHYLDIEWKKIWKNIQPKTNVPEHLQRHSSYFEGPSEVGEAVNFHYTEELSHRGIVGKVHEYGHVDIEFSGIARNVQVDNPDCYEFIARNEA